MEFYFLFLYSFSNTLLHRAHLVYFTIYSSRCCSYSGTVYLIIVLVFLLRLLPNNLGFSHTCPILPLTLFFHISNTHTNSTYITLDCIQPFLILFKRLYSSTTLTVSVLSFIFNTTSYIFNTYFIFARYCT